MTPEQEVKLNLLLELQGIDPRSVKEDAHNFYFRMTPATEIKPLATGSAFNNCCLRKMPLIKGSAND